MNAILHVLPHAEVDALVEQARQDHARFIEAAEEATRVHRSVRRANHLARQAGAIAAEIVADIPVLAEELANEAKEIESLHRHMAVAIRGEWRQKLRAEAAEADVVWLRNELTRLLAENDQLRATVPS